MVREALRLLQDRDSERGDALKELKSKLRRGMDQADRDELFDGEEVFEELRQMIAERKRARSTAGNS